MSGSDDKSPAQLLGSGLRKLWLALTLLAVLIVFNVLIATQGSGGVTLGLKATLNIEFADDIPEAVAAFWGVVWLSVLGIATGAVLFAHGRNEPGGWSDRYPFRMFEIPTAGRPGRIIQVVAVLLLTLAPAYMLGHSWRVLIGHGIRCVEVKDAAGALTWVNRDKGVFTPVVSTGSETGKQRLGSSELRDDQDPCGKARTIDYAFPFETWLFALVTGSAFAATGLGLWGVFAPRKQQRAAETPPADPTG